MSTNLTLTARELELLKEVGKHLQTASVSQLPLPAPSFPLIHLSLNKALFRLPNNLHSLTHLRTKTGRLVLRRSKHQLQNSQSRSR